MGDQQLAMLFRRLFRLFRFQNMVAKFVSLPFIGEVGVLGLEII